MPDDPAASFEAWEHLIREACGYMLRFLPRWMDAEDLYQAARLKVWRAADREPSLNANYVYRIARNTAISEIQRAYRLRSPQKKHYDIERRMLDIDRMMDTADGPEVIRDIVRDPAADTERAALSRLGVAEIMSLCRYDHQRLALALLIAERPYPEIAQIIGRVKSGIPKLLRRLEHTITERSNG